MIYHITSRSAWETAQRQGSYVAASLASEGLIHASTQSQVVPVAELYYPGQSDLVVLVIDPVRLTSKLKWESPTGGQPPAGVPETDLFPHIYGPLNLEAVVNVVDLKTDDSNKFFFSEP